MSVLGGGGGGGGPCTHGLVRQRDIDELIQSTGTQDGRINNVRSIGGSNDEDILLGTHTIHLGQDLVDDSVSCPSCDTIMKGKGLLL